MVATGSLEREKEVAADAAAELVRDGMAVGLGTGTTVAYLLPALARRGIRARCVATSPRTEEAARRLGIDVRSFDTIGSLDIAIDGADQIAPDGWLVKGGGGAHTREKIVAAAAERFVVIGDSSKPVGILSGPIPLELLRFGLASTIARLDALGFRTRTAAAETVDRLATVRVRDVPPSPDGGVIADLEVNVAVDDPRQLAELLGAVPGVVEHGLFPPEMVSAVIIGRGDRAVELRLAH
jgi:ribose 5-phosphate isomerase A